MPALKKKPKTSSTKTKKEDIVVDEEFENDIEDNISEEDFEEIETVESNNDYYDDSDEDYYDDSDDDETDDDSDDDENEDDSDDDENEDDSEEEVEEPVVKKKTVKKTVKKEENKPSSKKTVKKTVKKEDSSNNKTVKKSTKPTKEKSTPKKEGNKVEISKDKKSEIIKNYKEKGVEDFVNNIENGAFDCDISNKFQVTREEFIKKFINNIFEVISGESSETKPEDINRIKSIFDFERITLTNAKAVIEIVEKTFMDMISNQKTFTWGYNPSDGSKLAFKRRFIIGRIFDGLTNVDKHYYVPSHIAMNIEYPVNKSVIYGKNDRKNKVFISENGKKYNLEKENKKSIEKDKKEYSRNYPSHLSKK